MSDLTPLNHEIVETYWRKLQPSVQEPFPPKLRWPQWTEMSRKLHDSDHPRAFNLYGATIPCRRTSAYGGIHRYRVPPVRNEKRTACCSQKVEQT